MPKFYVIAGPPGIGKSTNFYDFLPKDIEILNHDLLKSYLKSKKLTNYQELSNTKIWELLNENFLLNNDFGIELNLGFESHYNFVKQIQNKYSHYSTHILLFYTDDVELCQNRAAFRYKNGGHLVEPNVIDEMYKNTLPLFLENKELFDNVQFVNVTYNSIRLIYSGIFKENKHIFFLEKELPKWAAKLF